jgi:S-adenosylmethionine hydrolase
VTFVSFTTDYGLADGFVAACHGVLLRAAPTVRIIDVTHLVPPGDIRRGATVLAQTITSLPRGVHLAVVDPGVGTARRPVVVRAAGGQHLVGPDNGLLLDAADRLGGIEAAVRLPIPAGTPATFHGRDVFAPAAARLALGEELAALGTPLNPSTLVRLPTPHARLGPDGVLDAEVVLVDIFGNVQLAATGSLLADAGLAPPARARLKLEPALGSGPGSAQESAQESGPGTEDERNLEIAVGETFGAVAPGELLLYVDAAGMAALAVRDGSAARALRLAPGDRITLRRARS